ncbi:response regulator transcription factor [Brevifollis gellanilyticus]|uniref:DNA-binding response regulator n=1 Tax=Brevifollis gellanilyticus TaxID=748831 RepID=A0A512M844_9BACT|nr:response regulator transcription factor [Brevifollis gellanilyticus]GEP42898.1 DNA-binding response regulator [Brevifollis gellanilyticus]
MSKALIIDDETQMRRLLRMVLETRGHEVCEAADGQLGLQEAAFHRPDVVLLDLGLPGLSGIEVLKRLREWSDVPVLILSVRDQEAVKVEALEAGADDYVTKPFGTAELLARLNVIQRRRFTRQSPQITAGALVLDLLHHEATLEDAPLKLTPTEFALIKVLAEHAGRIVTQNQIIRQVWAGQSSDASEGLRVHINHLRKKLGETGPKIVNEPGIGYRLEAE